MEKPKVILASALKNDKRVVVVPGLGLSPLWVFVDDDGDIYLGEVGTNFTAATSAELIARLTGVARYTQTCLDDLMVMRAAVIAGGGRGFMTAVEILETADSLGG